MLKINDQTKGNISNIISMISYAFYPAFLMAFGFIEKSGDSFNKIVMAAAIVAGKELFTFAAYVFINGVPATYESISKHMRGKWGLLAVTAGALGGPVGFTFLTVGVQFIGASSPDAVVLSLAIVIALVLEKTIFKKNVNKKQTIGISLTILGAILLLVLQQSKSGWTTDLALGMGFAVGGAIAWGGEAVLADYVMKNNTTGMTSKNFLSIKLSSSSVISFILMFIISGMFNHDNSGFNTFKLFFTDIEYLWKIVLVGFSMVLARFAFFFGIDKTNSFITSTVVTMQIIAIPILLIIFDATSSVSIHKDDIDLIYDYRFWLIAITITIGSIMASLTYNGIKYLKRNKD